MRVELRLISGERVEFELEPPGRSSSSYFVFTKDAGNQQIWPFVKRVLAAAHQPVCQFSTDLYKRGLKVQDVARESLNELLVRDGYAFGVVWDYGSLSIDLDQSGRRTFLFVRDPRDVIALAHEPSNPVPVADFLKSPVGVGHLQAFQKLVDFYRQRRNVSIVRYEDVFFGWSKLALEVVATLSLKVPLDVVFQLAASTRIMAQSERIKTFRQRYDEPDIAALEARLATSMALFGYAPVHAPSNAFLECQAEFLRALEHRQSIPIGNLPGAPPANRLAVDGNKAELAQKPIQAIAPREQQHVPRPTGIFESDPELNYRLKPNARTEMFVLGRRVPIEINAEGCRLVVGQPASCERSLSAYGCSFTFGTALPADETFCSRLQSMFPRWRVDNYGVGGYSGAQNLIQLQRNIRWNASEYVTFCWIEAHLRRNVAEFSWLRSTMLTTSRSVLPKPRPLAGLDSTGNVELRMFVFPRFDLLDVDLSDFRPDPYYSDLVCAAIFRRANELVCSAGGHFFVTTLQGKMSQALLRMLDEDAIPVVHATLNGPEYLCLPDDPHPNTMASQHYAEKIRNYIVNREGI